MRKIIAAEHMSLDGVVEAPERWSFAYFNEELGQEVGASMATADAMLMGRTTYEEWAAFWPNQDPEENRFANHMNGVQKYVVSTHLKGPLGWQNSTLIEGDGYAEEVSGIKRREGGDITVSGSGGLVRSLLRDGLLDELRLMVYPVVLGGGKRLFDEDGDRKGLELADSKTFATGVVYLTYRTASG